MIIKKIKVKQVKKLEDNLEIDAGSGTFSISDGHLVIYDVENKEIKEDASGIFSEITPEERAAIADAKKREEEKKRKLDEDWTEFVLKTQIRPGYHKFDLKDGMLSITIPDEVFFETKASIYLKQLFSNFFDKSDLLQEKFKKNKRSYLLYSEPGMGKSALIRNFCKFTLEKEGTAILVVDGDVNFTALTNIFLRPYAEGVKRIVLVIEDFGKKDNSSGLTYNPSCLNFLDGTAGLFRVPTMILSTTNFVRELGPQLNNRPGRFNKLINVSAPTDEEIFQLVEGIGSITLSEEQKQVFRGKNMTPDHVIEAIIRAELEGITLQESATEVMKEREGMSSFVN